MYGLIEKKSTLKEADAIYNEVLDAGLGWLHEVKKGQSLRIVDLEGNQAVDTTFYDAADPGDHYGAIAKIVAQKNMSRIHISEPTRLLNTSYAGFCLNTKKYLQNTKKKKANNM